jgi:hypothetical protein
MAGKSEGNSSGSMRICGSPPAEAPIATMSRWKLALAMGKPTMTVQRRQKAHRAQKARTTKPMMTATAGRTISPDMGCTKRSRSPHQGDDHSGACERWRLAAFLLLGCCREGTRVAHVAPGGWLVAIQPSERWTGEIRNWSIWPLKGSAMPLTCCSMPTAAELRSMSWVSLI